LKTLHYLIGAVLFLALLAGAVFVLSLAFQGAEAWTAALDEAKHYAMEAAFGALLLALLTVLFFLTSFRLPAKSQYIAYDIEGSSVSVNLKAVQEFLARLAGEFAAVEELTPALRAHHGAVDVQLDVKVRAGAQIPELCRMLQERARATLREKVGLSDVREVSVRVQEIVGTASAETASGDRPDTFTA
jgi:hypothetical protein